MLHLNVHLNVTKCNTKNSAFPRKKTVTFKRTINCNKLSNGKKGKAMKKLCNYLAAACLLVCGCIFAFEAQARVCFATDGSCGGAVDFPEQTPDVVKEQCAQDGYTESSCEPYQLEYRCPYKASLKKCCDKDYGYTACPYPLQLVGTCGSKYKCACDKSTYKYSYDGAGGSTKCKNNSTPGGVSCVQQTLNTKNKSSLDTQTFFTECKCDLSLYPYEAALKLCSDNADHGDECVSIDAKGKERTYYSTCYCDPKKFPYTAIGCYPFVGEEKGACGTPSNRRYKSCKTCSGWPAENLAHVAHDYKYSAADPYALNGVDEKDYDVCPYAQVPGHYKILACRDPGYRVSRDGDYDVDEDGNLMKDKDGKYISLKEGQKCIPMECKEAVKEFIKSYSSSSSSLAYGLFTGSKVVGFDGQTPSTATIAIVAEDVNANGYNYCSSTTTVQRRVCKKFCCRKKFKKVLSTPDEGEDTEGEDTEGEDTEESDGDSDEYAEIEDDTTCIDAGSYDLSSVSAPAQCIDDSYACSEVSNERVTLPNSGLSCTAATTYYSGQYLGKNFSSNSDSVKALNVACKKSPTINFSGNFPNKSASVEQNKSIATYGVNIKFNSSNVNSGYLSMHNGKVSGTVYFNGNTILDKDSSKPNAENAVVEGNATINSYFTSTGYDYKANSITVNNGAGRWKGVMFEGLNNSMRSTIKANSFTIKGIAGFKYINANVKNTYLGCSSSGPGVPYSTVTLYNSDWYLYDYEQSSRPKNYLYLNAATVFGYIPSKNSSKGQILFATSARVSKCRAATREKHSKNGSHSCNKHVGGPGGNHTFYYVNESGYRASVNVGKGSSDWCASGGDYNSPNEWVDWGYYDGDNKWTFKNGNWDSMYMSCE